jgi:hypothetical protein
MNPNDKAWSRLVEAARRAPDDRDLTAPYGFAARVVARAMSAERPALSLLGYFAPRALGVACVMAAVVVAVNYGSIVRLFQDKTPPSDDPIAELVDIAS